MFLTRTDALQPVPAAPRTPGARLKMALPWIGSALLVAWLVHTQDLQALRIAMADAQLGRLGVVFAVWAGLNLFVEGTFLHLALRWIEGVGRLGDLLRARAASYLLSAVHAIAGYGGLVLYMRRRFGVPVARGTVLMINESLQEVGAMGTLAFVSAMWLRGMPGLPDGAPAAIDAVAAFGLGSVVFYAICIAISRITRWLQTPRTPLSLFEEIELKAHAGFFGIKLMQNLLHGVWVWAALGCFGCDAPLLAAIAFVQLIRVVRALPVTAFGIGADQLTVPILFVAWEPTLAPGRLLAFSIFYTAAMLVGRGLVGLPFVQGCIDDIQESK